MSGRITRAMVLAAGLGRRMRPLSEETPKPLIEVAGKPLIDHVLDRIAAEAVELAVVNVHYRADQIEAHLEGRERPRIVISNECEGLLDTGGGVKKALPLLGRGAFLCCNSDSLSIGGASNSLERLARMWDEARMDALLLLAPAATALGYEGRGDFAMDQEGRLRRRREKEVVPFVFTGTSLLHPRLFEGTPAGAFSLNLPWDAAIGRGRLFGLRQDGYWMHIGDPQALAAAGRVIESGEPRWI